MPKTITRDEAMDKIQDFLNDEKVKYNKSFGRFTIYYDNPRLWANDASVHIKEKTNGQYTVTISWSSSERTVPMAMSTLDTYQKAISLAARIQAFLDILPEVVDK